jgi:hypothetical protein
VYKYANSATYYGHTRTSLRRIALGSSPSYLLRAQRVGAQVSEIAVRRATLARVCGRSGFWERIRDVHVLLALSARPTPIWFFVVGAVRETTTGILKIPLPVPTPTPATGAAPARPQRRCPRTPPGAPPPPPRAPPPPPRPPLPSDDVAAHVVEVYIFLN